MEKLLNARLFSWLEEDARKDLTNDEVELMVREFTGDLEKRCDEERDCCMLFRVLECICIRLRVLDERFRTGDRTEKNEVAYWCTRAVLWRVEAEIQFMRERLLHPEWFVGRLEDGSLAVWRSENPKIEIVELALGLSLMKVLWSPRGVVMEYDEVIKLAERVFGVKLPNYRELKRDVFKRKKDVAAFLKRLAFLVEQARDEKDAR